MATAAGIIVVTGAITLGNEMLGAPYKQGQTDVYSQINWRVIPATAVAAMIFGGIEQVNAPMAKALAYLAMITVLFTRMGNALSPAENLANVMGYGPTTTQGKALKGF